MGDQWVEASSVIGLWGLTSAITIVLSHYSSEAYRAKGRPKLSVLAQVLHLIVLCPAVLIAVKFGFETLAVTRALVRLESILVNLILMYVVVKVSPWKMFKNVFYSVLASLIMAVLAMLLKDLSVSVIWQFISIVICALMYFSVILIVPANRVILKSLINRK